MENAKYYTPEILTEQYGFDENRFDEDDYCGVKCINYGGYYSRAENDYQQLEYYIFKSEAEAKKAFNRSAEYFYDDAETGDNYRKGWIAGVCDASILGYEYLSGNMIIYTDVAVIGCWGTEEELANQPGPDYEYIDHIIEFINSEF